jgi:hypothetical protein
MFKLLKHVVLCLIRSLVFLDANGVVKLGDFGLSKQLGAQAFTNTYVGVRRFLRSLEHALMIVDSLLHVSRIVRGTTL